MKTTIYILVIGLMMILSGCWNDKSVIITKEYVINPYWDKIDNSFTITKMKLKDNYINLEEPSNYDLYNGLIEDKSFSYTTNVEYNGVEYPPLVPAYAIASILLVTVKSKQARPSWRTSKPVTLVHDCIVDYKYIFE